MANPLNMSLSMMIVTWYATVSVPFVGSMIVSHVGAASNVQRVWHGVQLSIMTVVSMFSTVWIMAHALRYVMGG